MPDGQLSRRRVLAGGIVVGAATGIPAVLLVKDSELGPGSRAPARHVPVARPRELPTAFERARVCGHNGAGLMPYIVRGDKIAAGVYNRNAEAWSILGARAAVRPVKSRDEDPWWPSSVPSTSAAYFASARTNVVLRTVLDRRAGEYRPAEAVRIDLSAGENLVAEWLAEAKRQDVLMVAYYRYYNERSLADGAETHGETAHPSWVVKHQDGSDWESSTGKWLDITTPTYRDIVAARLVELGNYGVQAFYFDALGLPNAEGPRGTATAAAYAAQTGTRPPTATPFTSTTPGALGWRQFCANRLAEAYGIINSTLKGSHPDTVFIASCTYLPGLTLPFHNTHMLAVIDSPKTEWGLAYAAGLQDNVFGDRNTADCEVTAPSTSCANLDLPRPDRETQRAMGWTVLRDGANGRPFHCWVEGTATAEQAPAAAAGIIAYGGIASMLGNTETLAGVLDATDRRVRGATPRAGLEASLALSEAAGPYLVNANPVRYVAVLFSEQRRDAIGQGDAKVAWQEVLWPTLGGFEGFLKARVPVGVVNDSQLTAEGLHGYQVLYVWSRSALTAAQAREVDQFERSGGAIVEAPGARQWASRAGNTAAAQAMSRIASQHRATSPVSVTGPPAGMRAIPYSQQARGGPTRLVIAVVNDFSHVQITSVQSDPALQGDTKPRPLPDPNPPRPAVTGALVHWKKSMLIDGETHSRPTAAYCIIDQDATRVELTYDAESSSRYAARLPRFQHLAMVVIEYQ